ncbi:MAG: AAA family ATPase [Planctomycetes bacterium]|nr:AAA family ATPase [Planctomycetota bacterium]
MSTTGELVRRIVQAFMIGDASSFRTAAEEYIAEERRKNHHVLARDIEKLLLNGASTTASARTLALIGTQSSDLPRDKERGTVLVEIIEPKRTLESLVLAEGIRNTLSAVIHENRHADVLRSYGLRPASKILFCGPPGCGKTVAAEGVAQALYLPLVLVRFDAIVSSYLGETAANLRKVFDFVRTRPMVALFDEFDAIGKSRTAEEEHGELKRVVNSFLQMLDRFRGETLLIAATNHQGLLDSALWRRFDEILFFDRPDTEAIREILVRNTTQLGLEQGTDLERLSRGLCGMSHADIERIALDATKASILMNRHPIEAEALIASAENQRRRVSLTDNMTSKSEQHASQLPTHDQRGTCLDEVRSP